MFKLFYKKPSKDSRLEVTHTSIRKESLSGDNYPAEILSKKIIEDKYLNNIFQALICFKKETVCLDDFNDHRASLIDAAKKHIHDTLGKDYDLTIIEANNNYLFVVHKGNLKDETNLEKIVIRLVEVENQNKIALELIYKKTTQLTFNKQTNNATLGRKKSNFQLNHKSFKKEVLPFFTKTFELIELNNNDIPELIKETLLLSSAQMLINSDSTTRYMEISAYCNRGNLLEYFNEKYHTPREINPKIFEEICKFGLYWLRYLQALLKNKIHHPDFKIENTLTAGFISDKKSLLAYCNENEITWNMLQLTPNCNPPEEEFHSVEKHLSFLFGVFLYQAMTNKFPAPRPTGCLYISFSQKRSEFDNTVCKHELANSSSTSNSIHKLETEIEWKKPSKDYNDKLLSPIHTSIFNHEFGKSIKSIISNAMVWDPEERANLDDLEKNLLTLQTQLQEIKNVSQTDHTQNKPPQSVNYKKERNRSGSVKEITHALEKKEKKVSSHTRTSSLTTSFLPAANSSIPPPLPLVKLPLRVHFHPQSIHHHNLLYSAQYSYRFQFIDTEH